MNQTKIDYTLTIQNFLKSVLEFLDVRAGNSTTMWEYNTVTDTIEKLRIIADNPRRFIADARRVFSPLAFAHNGASRNAAYVAFIRAMNAIKLIYATENHDAREFLAAVKQWKYLTSTNSFKNFYYPFISPMRFAAKRQIER